MQDLVGQQYGLITVIASLGGAQDMGYSGRGQMVLGRCSCGNEWTGRADSLRRGTTKSCGCLTHGRRPQADRERPAINRLRRNYKRHAERRSLAWNITDQAFETLIKQDCFYCGAGPSSICRQIPKPPRRTGNQVIYNGIDRKDNTMGYEITNVVACCATCNYAKRGLPAADFIAHAKKIAALHA